MSEQTKFTFNGKESKNWSSDNEINELFLRNVHRFMTDRLRLSGHLFLNEVLDELALPRTSEGQLKGWLYEDGRVYSLWEETTRSGSDDIEIIFSVDGIIYDKIEGEK